MLIPFGQLVKKYGLKVRGVLHVGAHMCEELSAYEAEGVKEIVWLEANESLVKLQRHMGRNVHHILASEKNGMVVDFQHQQQWTILVHAGAGCPQDLSSRCEIHEFGQDGDEAN